MRCAAARTVRDAGRDEVGPRVTSEGREVCACDEGAGGGGACDPGEEGAAPSLLTAPPARVPSRCRPWVPGKGPPARGSRAAAVPLVYLVGALDALGATRHGGHVPPGPAITCGDTRRRQGAIRHGGQVPPSEVADSPWCGRPPPTQRRWLAPAPVPGRGRVPRPRGPRPPRRRRARLPVTPPRACRCTSGPASTSSPPTWAAAAHSGALRARAHY